LRVIRRRCQASSVPGVTSLSDGIGLSDDPRWPHVDGWAAELGLTGPAP
jgi:hypothetical protein